VEEGSLGEGYVRGRPNLAQRCAREASDDLATLDAKESLSRSLAPGDGQ